MYGVLATLFQLTPGLQITVQLVFLCPVEGGGRGEGRGEGHLATDSSLFSDTCDELFS